MVKIKRVSDLMKLKIVEHIHDNTKKKNNHANPKWQSKVYNLKVTRRVITLT